MLATSELSPTVVRVRRLLSRPRTLPGDGRGASGSELTLLGVLPTRDSVRAEVLRGPRRRGEPALCARLEPMSPMSTPLRLRNRPLLSLR